MKLAQYKYRQQLYLSADKFTQVLSCNMHYFTESPCQNIYLSMIDAKKSVSILPKLLSIE